MPFTTDTANLYRIETTRKAVILSMLGGEEVRGNVFIHFSPYRPFELEEVSELFNSESPFFPLELDNNEVILVAKSESPRSRLTEAKPPQTYLPAIHHPRPRSSRCFW